MWNTFQDFSHKFLKSYNPVLWYNETYGYMYSFKKLKCLCRLKKLLYIYDLIKTSKEGKRRRGNAGGRAILNSVTKQALFRR